MLNHKDISSLLDFVADVLFANKFNDCTAYEQEKVIDEVEMAVEPHKSHPQEREFFTYEKRVDMDNIVESKNKHYDFNKTNYYQLTRLYNN